MKYVYGPVPSKRLGQSLGIDPIPLKTCNWNCVYCQLGRTRPVVNERKDYVPPDEILEEIVQSLESHNSGEIDWVTFVGSGEPALHASLGWMISHVKANTEIPVAVITNGSLLYLPKVRKELRLADAVLPSVDAGTEKLYRTINRPHPQITYDKLLQGLIDFRKEFSGELWVEVMLLRGLNDSEQSLHAIAKVLQKIKPDQVHINLPTRPPVETWVRPTDNAGLTRAMSILGEIAHVVHPTEGKYEMSSSKNLVDAVVEIIGRHPMREDEIVRTLEQLRPGNVEEAMRDLKASPRIQIIDRFGNRYWCSAKAYYPNEARSAPTAPHHR